MNQAKATNAGQAIRAMIGNTPATANLTRTPEQQRVMETAGEVQPTPLAKKLPV